jgi:hypothetical protein
MDLTNWRQLSDQGPDLIPCLDFPGGRVTASFADLAAGMPAAGCFLHLAKAGGGPLAARAGHWAAELTAAGRPVRAVLGFCAGAPLATALGDAIAATSPPPMVIVFDAILTTGGSLASQFTNAVESSAKHMTADELQGARDLAEHLVATYPDDMPRIAAALADRYGQLMRAVAGRLSLPEFLVQELTTGLATYLDYLVLAGEGGLDMRTSTPLFVCSVGYELPVEGARAIALDVDHSVLLRDPEVHKLVTDLLTGEHPW